MSERKNNLAEMNAAQKLLGWYDRYRRVLPWRALPGETTDRLPRLAVRDYATTDNSFNGKALL